MINISHHYIIKRSSQCRLVLLGNVVFSDSQGKRDRQICVCLASYNSIFSCTIPVFFLKDGHIKI